MAFVRARRAALVAAGLLIAGLLVAFIAIERDPNSADILEGPSGIADEPDGTTPLVTAAPFSGTTAAAAATTAAAAATTAAGGADTTAAAAGGADLEQLAAECTEEGQVNLIALADEWANYRGILQSFRDKYPGVENPVRTPTSSHEEVDDGPTWRVRMTCPTTLTSALPWHRRCRRRTVGAVRTEVVDELPEGLMDPDGDWVAGYYGIISFRTNITIVPNAPQTFADLKKPEYEGLVALDGDPRSRAPPSLRSLPLARQRRQRGRHHARHRVLRELKASGNLSRRGHLGDDHVG